MSNIKNIIDNIQEDNLVDAKNLIKSELLSRVGSMLEEAIENIAPSMISEKSDKNDKDDKDDKPKMFKKKKDGNEKETKMIKDSYEQEEVIDPRSRQEDEDDFDYSDDFESFVDQIQEIVQEIEDETGEELTEEEIIQLGQEYLNMLSEELDSEEVIEEELVGNQYKLDANKNGRVDAGDFPRLKRENVRNKNKGK